MTALPSVASLSSLDAESRALVLDLLFEPCTQLHTLSVSSLAESTFPTYDALIASVGSQLTDLFKSDLESDQKWLDSILSAHPRLGEKKVESELSRQEQAAMAAASGGSGDSEEIQKMLAALNQEYEAIFPGLRYVVFVNGRSRPVIIEDMQRRIAREDIKQEKLDAIEAMCDIARDRARKLQSQ